MNLLELRNGVVHADGGDGRDYTLCGLTAENILDDISDYDAEDEDPELVPAMSYTRRKIDCPACAAIIRYCVSLGTRAIGKVREE